MLLAVAGPLLWLFLRGALGLFVNATTSLPPGVYQLRDEAPAVGEAAMSCLAEGPSALALVRGYVARGSCPHGTAPLGKVVAARAGDTVRLTAGGVYVGGRLLAASAPLRRDSRGHPLPDVRGTYVLGPGQVWLYSGYDPKSFDSRYFGPVPDSLILGRAGPLWTWGRAYDARGALGLP